MNKVIFLDRDGVINYDPGAYTTNVRDFKILPDVIDVLKSLNRLGYGLIVITNQGGIAKGLYNKETFDEIDAEMHRQFLANDIKVLQTFYCPHHPDYGKCLCRKPLSLLALKALSKYKADPSVSFFIGDKQRDIECAEGAGVRGILIETNSSLIPVLESIKAKV